MLMCTSAFWACPEGCGYSSACRTTWKLGKHRKHSSKCMRRGQSEFDTGLWGSILWASSPELKLRAQADQHTGYLLYRLPSNAAKANRHVTHWLHVPSPQVDMTCNLLHPKAPTDLYSKDVAIPLHVAVMEKSACWQKALQGSCTGADVV